MKCPTCGKQFDPRQSQAMPFCCPRCRQIDLGRWASEHYTIPGQPLDDDPEADAAAGDDTADEPSEN